MYEDSDTDTDEDDGEDLDGSDFPGQVGQDDDVIQQYLYQSYVFHKKRWRRFTGRPTRYSRFGNSKGKGSLIPYRGSFGGRSSGKGYHFEGKGGRRNPIGRDGKVVQCLTDSCKSEFHLIKDCPHKKGKGSKGGKGAFIVDGPKPLTGAGAGIPWFGFNTGATSSGAAPTTPAYGSGSVSFFATEIPKTLENTASVTGSKGFYWSCDSTGCDKADSD